MDGPNDWTTPQPTLSFPSCLLFLPHHHLLSYPLFPYPSYPSFCSFCFSGNFYTHRITSLSLVLVILLRRLILQANITHGRVRYHVLPDRCPGDLVVPAGDVGVLITPLFVQHELEPARQQRNGEEVGKGEAIADEEGAAVGQVDLEELGRLERALARVLDALFVVGDPVGQRPEPAADLGQDLVVGVRHEAQDRGEFLVVAAQERGVFVLFGDCYSMR